MSDPLSPRALMDRLVAFPTVSRDSNLALVDWVEEYLDGFGITAHRVWNADRTKAALYAHVGPEVPGAVILSGHTDVVPVDGQAWTTDPWAVTDRDGRLHGRGTCDMKGFDALAIWALVEARRRGVTRPLQLALSYDEEIGCTGAPPLIAAMAAHLPRAAAVIVGEPSRMAVVTAHKGGAAFKVLVRGHAVHSSLLPDGVSAVMEAARIVQWVNEANDAVRAAAPSALAAQFHPPFTTLHVGTIRGGIAQNITAATCELVFEVRAIPDEGLALWEDRFRAACARVEAGMRRVHPGCAVVVEPFFVLPPLAPESQGPAEALARRLTGDNGRHVVSYGTEAGHFQAGGYSTVVCGPGDIAQAHQPDEYIEVAQFEAGHAFMRRLLDDPG